MAVGKADARRSGEANLCLSANKDKSSEMAAFSFIFNNLSWFV